mgnify:FL=1
MKKKQNLPDGMTEKDVLETIKYFENQTEDEAIAEAEAVFGPNATTIIEIPRRILPQVRAMIAREAKTKRAKAA